MKVVLKVVLTFEFFRHEKLTKKMILHNEFIQLMDDHDWKFVPNDKNADCIVTTLVNVLWYLDPHRARFKERSISLPFPQFHDYYDWKVQKKGKPVIKSPELKEQIDKLSSILMKPWWNNDHVQTFKAKVDLMLEGMAKYHKYLNRNNESNMQRQQNEGMYNVHASEVGSLVNPSVLDHNNAQQKALGRGWGFLLF